MYVVNVTIPIVVMNEDQKLFWFEKGSSMMNHRYKHFNESLFRTNGPITL
jgi:hypothetical protein